MPILITIKSEPKQLRGAMVHRKTNIQEISNALGQLELIKLKLIGLLAEANARANKYKNE